MACIESSAFVIWLHSFIPAFLLICHPSSHASVKSHSPHSSACRYFPVQSECSPAPGRESSECSQPQAVLLRFPQANWRHAECINASQSEHKVTPRSQVCEKVSLLGSGGALSGLWCRRAGSALSCWRWQEATGRRPTGHESSSNPSSASSPHRSLCAPPARRKSLD